MNTNKRQVQVMDRATPLSTELMGLQAQQLMALGQDLGWETAVLGQAALPERPVRAGNWLIIPATQDTSVIPERAFKRVQTLYAAGIRPKGFVLVHEAPALLAAPAAAKSTAGWRAWLPGQKKAADVAATGRGARAATILVQALALLAVGAVVIVALPLVALIGVVALDPILIAVTEDDDWIEIDRWDIAAD
jgi:hypothetical protein